MRRKKLLKVSWGGSGDGVVVIGSRVQVVKREEMGEIDR